jgi:hypothetical protein
MKQLYWQELLHLWQELEFDIGGIILQNVYEIADYRAQIKVVNREFINQLKEVCCKGKRRVLREDVSRLCISNQNFNGVRELLPTRLGRTKERMFVTWLTPIEQMHLEKYSIAGLIGRSVVPRANYSIPKGRDRRPIKLVFETSYEDFKNICKERGWPTDNVNWQGGKEVFNRRLMDIEEDEINEL